MSSGTEGTVHTVPSKQGESGRLGHRCSLGLNELADILLNKEETRASESG